VVETKGSANVETVYDPAGGKLATVSGGTLNQGYFPLPGGDTAVWTLSGLAYYRRVANPFAQSIDA
jgi:hypothetical protein